MVYDFQWEPKRYEFDSQGFNAFGETEKDVEEAEQESNGYHTSNSLIYMGTKQPVGPQAGGFWFEPTSGKAFIWTGEEWMAIDPEPEGRSAPVPDPQYKCAYCGYQGLERHFNHYNGLSCPKCGAPAHIHDGSAWKWRGVPAPSAESEIDT